MTRDTLVSWRTFALFVLFPPFFVLAVVFLPVLLLVVLWLYYRGAYDARQERREAAADGRADTDSTGAAAPTE